MKYKMLRVWGDLLVAGTDRNDLQELAQLAEKIWPTVLLRWGSDLCFSLDLTKKTTSQPGYEWPLIAAICDAGWEPMNDGKFRKLDGEG